MSEFELLRAEAERCRQLAGLLIDQRVQSTLLQMSAECERCADEIETGNQERALRLRAIIESEPV
jgi:hypothetical protein